MGCILNIITNCLAYEENIIQIIFLQYIKLNNIQSSKIFLYGNTPKMCLWENKGTAYANEIYFDYIVTQQWIQQLNNIQCCKIFSKSIKGWMKSSCNFRIFPFCANDYHYIGFNI